MGSEGEGEGRSMRGNGDLHRMRGWTRKVRGNDTRVGLLLPERARSECARSTAAVRPDTGAVPNEGKRASLEGAISMLWPCGTTSLNILEAQERGGGYLLDFEVDLPALDC